MRAISDTDLNITFGSFSSLLDRLSAMTPESFEVPSFEEELPNLERKIADVKFRAKPESPW
jgi:hypothetical protein